MDCGGPRSGGTPHRASDADGTTDIARKRLFAADHCGSVPLQVRTGTEAVKEERLREGGPFELGEVDALVGGVDVGLRAVLGTPEHELGVGIDPGQRGEQRDRAAAADHARRLAVDLGSWRHGLRASRGRRVRCSIPATPRSAPPTPGRPTAPRPPGGRSRPGTDAARRRPVGSASRRSPWPAGPARSPRRWSAPRPTRSPRSPDATTAGWRGVRYRRAAGRAACRTRAGRAARRCRPPTSPSHRDRRRRRHRRRRASVASMRISASSASGAPPPKTPEWTGRSRVVTSTSSTTPPRVVTSMTGSPTCSLPPSAIT